MPRGKHLTLTEKATIIAERSIGKSFRTIAKGINRNVAPVYRNYKATESNDISNIRERVLIALKEKGLDDLGYADKCIELLNCKRYQLQPDGSMDLVPDNQTQAKVLNTVKDIMGLDAVKQSEVKHTIELSPAENDEIMIIRRKHNIINTL